MLTAKDLLGRWVSPQLETIPTADGNVMYGLRDFILTEKAWAIRFTAYGDAAGTFKLFTLRVEGTYELGVPALVIPEARYADFHFTARYMTAYAPMFIELFNQVRAGTDAWQVDVEQDVSETGAVFIPSVAAAPVEYDLLKLDGDQLWFGDRTPDLTLNRAVQLNAYPVVRR